MPSTFATAGAAAAAATTKARMKVDSARLAIGSLRVNRAPAYCG